MKPEETIDFPIRWTWHRLARMYNQEAAKHGTTMSVALTLLNIEQEEGTPSTKLGPKMGMEPRSLTRTLKTMEDDGYIYRKADEVDGRVVRIFLTEKGEATRSIARNTVLKLNDFLYDNLPKGKVKTYFEVMEKINVLLTNTDIFDE